MDALDIGIIREMGLQPYGRTPRKPETFSPRYLAKALGVSPETIRERVGRMEAEGVISGYALLPNLHHLGLEASAYLLRVPEEALLQGLDKRLAPVEGMLGAYVFLGGTVCVGFAHRSPAERDRRLALVRSLCGATETTRFYAIDLPAVPRPLSPLDWRILHALHADALRPLAEVARDLGVNARTVKRHHARMAAEGSFFAIPVVDPARVPGLILFEFLFEFEPGADAATARAIRKVLTERLVCTDGTPGAGGACFGAGLYANAIGEVERLRRQAAAVPMVQRVQALVLAESWEEWTWLDEAIAERAQAPAAPRTRA